MPSSVRVSESGDFAYVRIYGVWTYRDLVAVWETFLGEPRLIGGFCDLFDTTQVTRVEVTREDILRYYDLTMQRPERLPRRSAVVAHSDQAWELLKIWEQALPAMHTVIVFNDLSMACQWLGVPLPMSNGSPERRD